MLLIIALQVLNLSVYSIYDGKTAASNSIGERNEIDCMAEYIAEIVLEHKQAFPENGTHNRQSNSSHLLKHGNFNLLGYKKVPEIKRWCIVSSIPVPAKQEYKYLYINEIIPPPPKRAHTCGSIVTA
ncbi:MAG TPA: hypothetical protein VHB48_06750 [Chitinophagaceae bacterium]|nr:hypothetical protein [Chitinophagaceae bacterium]